jgi:hypothetical protein
MSDVGDGVEVERLIQLPIDVFDWRGRALANMKRVLLQRTVQSV